MGEGHMTRKECESKIAKHLLEIRDIYRKYNPGASHLCLAITSDQIFFFNKHYREDAQYPINYFKILQED